MVCHSPELLRDLVVDSSTVPAFQFNLGFRWSESGFSRREVSLRGPKFNSAKNDLVESEKHLSGYA